MSGDLARIDRAALVEDLFGLNLRALRTLALAWLRPRKLADAARSRDWKGYTPAPRLLVVLIAFTLAFQFADLLVQRAAEDVVERSTMALPGFAHITKGTLPLSDLTTRDVTGSLARMTGDQMQHIGLASAVFLPLLVLGICLAALPFRHWRSQSPVSGAMRVRLAMLALLPATSAALGVTLAATLGADLPLPFASAALLALLPIGAWRTGIGKAGIGKAGIGRLLTVTGFTLAMLATSALTLALAFVI